MQTETGGGSVLLQQRCLSGNALGVVGPRYWSLESSIGIRTEKAATFMDGDIRAKKKQLYGPGEQGSMRYAERLRIVLRYLCLMLLLNGCDSEQRAVCDISIEEAAELLKNPEVIVLDLRTPREFAGGHLVGARNVDFNDPGFGENLAGLDRRRSYVVHSASGSRSGRALPLFGELGFEKINHLRPGFRGWVAAGYPVER